MTTVKLISYSQVPPGTDYMEIAHSCAEVIANVFPLMQDLK